MSKCANCGTELNDGALFCHKCGMNVSDAAPQSGVHEHDGNSSGMSADTKAPKKKKKRKNNKRKTRNSVIIVLLSMLLALMLLVAAIVISYLFMDEKILSDDANGNINTLISTVAPTTPSPIPRETPEPAQRPQSTLDPDVESVHVENPKYSTYTDPDYGFSCAYPSHFEKYVDNTVSGRYTLKNSDGSVSLHICAEKNDGGITIPQALSMLTSKSTGEIEFSRSGSIYYEVRINEGGICRYRYLVSKNGNFYWFELKYPEEYKYIYEDYEQHIYTSFTVK